MCWKLELIQALLIISITSVLWTKTFCVLGSHGSTKVHYVIDGYWEHLQPTSQSVSVSVSTTTRRSSVQVKCATSYWWTTLQFYPLAVFCHVFFWILGVAKEDGGRQRHWNRRYWNASLEHCAGKWISLRLPCGRHSIVLLASQCILSYIRSRNCLKIPWII